MFCLNQMCAGGRRSDFPWFLALLAEKGVLFQVRSLNAKVSPMRGRTTLGRKCRSIMVFVCSAGRIMDPLSLLIRFKLPHSKVTVYDPDILAVIRELLLYTSV